MRKSVKERLDWEASMAAEVMARLKNAKGRVVVAGVPPELLANPKGMQTRSPFRPGISREEAVRRQFSKNLNLKACAIACDQNGADLRGSIFLVAVVPTEDEVDQGPF